MSEFMDFILTVICLGLLMNQVYLVIRIREAEDDIRGLKDKIKI